MRSRDDPYGGRPAVGRESSDPDQRRSGGAAGHLAGTCTGARARPSILRIAFVTGLNGAGFRTFFLSFDRSDLRLDGKKVTDPFDRQVRVRGELFVLPYEVVSNRLVVMAVLPYLDKTLVMGSPGSRQQFSVNGFGDLAVAAKVGIYQRDRPNLTTRAALFGRLKLPTGDDDAVGPGGQALPKSLQLGTGSLDASAGLILTHSVGPLGLSGDVIYDFNTDSDGFAFGDVLHYDVALGLSHSAADLSHVSGEADQCLLGGERYLEPAQHSPGQPVGRLGRATPVAVPRRAVHPLGELSRGSDLSDARVARAQRQPARLRSDLQDRSAMATLLKPSRGRRRASDQHRSALELARR